MQKIEDVKNYKNRFKKYRLKKKEKMQNLEELCYE